MCLVKLEQIPRTSSLPIKVYKVLLSSDRSPFQYQEYHHGINEPGSIQFELPKGNQNIEGGYLHAYATWDSAVRALNPYAERTTHGVKVTEMYIPPETEYWIGVADEIAAKRLDWPEDALEWHAESFPPIDQLDLLFPHQ